MQRHFVPLLASIALAGACLAASAQTLPAATPALAPDAQAQFDAARGVYDTHIGYFTDTLGKIAKEIQGGEDMDCTYGEYALAQVDMAQEQLTTMIGMVTAAHADAGPWQTVYDANAAQRGQLEPLYKETCEF
jgi:hypothetical protein